VSRLRDERGAVSVIVALLMVPLIGFAAVAVDVAAMYAERSQLQAGADAGALAIAQDCGRGTCGSSSTTAQAYAQRNLSHASSTATVTAISTNSVTVSNTGIKQHLFAPVLGVDASVISASATASWGPPSGGTAVLPIAFSWCEWQAQTGGGLPNGTTQRVISLPTGPTTGCTAGFSGEIPPGFGWLHTDAGTCETTSRVAAQLRPSAGDTPPTGCSPADFVAQQGKTVILPLFDAASAAGYRIYGYAAFKITGYYFAGRYSWGSPCSGSDSCIKGYFTRLVDLGDSFTSDPGGPPLGAAIVRLTQ
jgi:hypothetical protein